MEGVAIVQKRGGAGKTTLCHLLAHGAALYKQQAHLMHTDDRAPIRVNGRRYNYYDARQPDDLSALVKNIINHDGLCIIDSGGNRPEFDKWISAYVDLVLIPVTPDSEAVNLALEKMEILQAHGAKQVKYILNQVSNYQNESRRDQREYFDAIPPDLIVGKLGKVAASKLLRDSDKDTFITPPTNVNNLARKMYRIVRNELNGIKHKVEQAA